MFSLVMEGVCGFCGKELGLEGMSELAYAKEINKLKPSSRYCCCGAEIAKDKKRKETVRCK